MNTTAIDNIKNIKNIKMNGFEKRLRMSLKKLDDNKADGAWSLFNISYSVNRLAESNQLDKAENATFQAESLVDLCILAVKANSRVGQLLATGALEKLEAELKRTSP